MTVPDHAPAAPLDLAVPAYVHPLEDPAAWERLTHLGGLLRFVVVNVHDGPGARDDDSYHAVVRALHGAGVRTVGYVDTDYGRRDPAAVLRDVRAWRDRYRVGGIFFDQVATGLDQLDDYAQLALAARAAGADYLVLNPGALPHPGYVDIANVTVTFEGSWKDYRRLEDPAWVQDLPAARFAHLVHAVPAGALQAAVARARRHHVRTIFATTGSGSNPWDRVPEELLAALGAPA